MSKFYVQFKLLTFIFRAFNKTKTEEVLHQNRLLGDGGYSNCRIINPTVAEILGCRLEQQVRRSIVEIVIGKIQYWKIAKETWRSPSVELQVQCLLVICELAQLSLMNSPQAPGSLTAPARCILDELSGTILLISPEVVEEKLKFVQGKKSSK